MFILSLCKKKRQQLDLNARVLGVEKDLKKAACLKNRQQTPIDLMLKIDLNCLDNLIETNV